MAPAGVEHRLHVRCHRLGKPKPVDDATGHTYTCAIAALFLFAAVFFLIAFLHHRYWWVIHGKRPRARPDGEVRDSRDTIDKWWGTALAAAIGTAFLVGAIVAAFD